MSNLKRFFINAWHEGTLIGKPTVLTAVFTGGIAHFVFYFVYKYGFGLNENIYVRLAASLICVSVAGNHLLSPKIRQKFFPFYWHLMVINSLPFVFTYNLLQNNFDEVWLYWEIFGVLLLALCVPNWLIYIIDLFIGVSAAALAFLISGGNFSDLHPQFNVLAYLICIVFSGFVGMCFTYSGRAVAMEKLYSEMLSLTASLVHEMRNPLNAINLTVSDVRWVSKNPKSFDPSRIENSMQLISDTIKQANAIINIALSDLQKKPINFAEFSYFKASEILPMIVDQYGYSEKLEKERVRVSINSDNDFIFRAVLERFTFIIYNLLKNSLYYDAQFSNLMVTVGTEKRTVKGQDYNVIYVQDNGPGISAQNFENLFNDFYTFGKKSGTGLGLAFCRRNMRALGGDIICESEFGDGKNGWTKFSLLFQKISEREVSQSQKIVQENQLSLLLNRENLTELLSGKEVLVADDRELNLVVMETSLRSFGMNVTKVRNGQELMNIYKNSLSENGKSKFDLILTDISMPFKNGYEVAQEIRNIEKGNKLDPSEFIVIIAISGDDDRSIGDVSKSSITDYFIKGDDPDYLMQIIAKNLVA